MTAPVPTTEPASVVAGDTLTWKRTLADYPAGTWTLKYRLINSAGKFDITATAERTDAAKILDQLNAAYIAYTASNGHVAEYEIAGRRMKYRSAAEILTQINFWEARVASEKRAERIAAGLGGGNKVLVRF
jgi:hypothetical protein